ncbi:MAG: acyl-CoA dehydrogenase family protein [Pseudomonadota bacterium]
MDFEWTSEQLALREACKKFAEKEIAPGARLRDQKGEKEFDWEAWKKTADFGLLGFPIPKEYGGSGVGPLELCIAMEGFGEGADDWGFVCSVGSHMVIGEIPIWEWGTDQQKMKYLPKMCSGEWVGAFALTEPDAGSDAASIRTKAERKGDYYVLNGSKTFITNGPIADVIVVFATQDRSKGKKGILALLVEKGFSGVSTTTLEKMGLKASPMGEIFFDDCKVPAQNVLGREGEGFAVAMSTLEWERTGYLACPRGACRKTAQRGNSLCEKTNTIREAHSGVPGHSAQTGRHEGVAGDVQVDVLQGGLEEEEWDTGTPGCIHSKAFFHRDQPDGGLECLSDPWHLWIYERVSH